MSIVSPENTKSTRRRPARKRAPWRQWLVEAERGVTAGFRSDSIFFVHLFVGSLAIAAAAMLGLSAAEWAVLVLALSVTTAAELFHQVLKQLAGLLAQVGSKPARTIGRFGVAAVAVAALGSGISIVILIGSRLTTLFGL